MEPYEGGYMRPTDVPEGTVPHRWGKNRGSKQPMAVIWAWEERGSKFYLYPFYHTVSRSICVATLLLLLLHLASSFIHYWVRRFKILVLCPPSVPVIGRANERLKSSSSCFFFLWSLTIFGAVVCLNERPSMPLLEIATSQPNFQGHLGVLRAQAHTNSKLFSSSFAYGSDRRLSSPCNTLNIHRKFPKTRLTALEIKAVATLEQKRLTLCDDGEIYQQNLQVGFHESSSTTVAKANSPAEDSEDLSEGEKLRRTRISKANKGNTPWNKGRKHSAETIQRIRERTRLAMQNPKVKMKLVSLGHAQTEETRQKIGVGVRMGWQKRREKLVVQETCYFDWQNLIAEASRRGYAGEIELQWDSYDILNKQLDLEWLNSEKERKTVQKQKGNRRAPKSPEQRRKIAEAIAAKWTNPEYREKVTAGLSKYHGVPVGVERKLRRTASSSTGSPRRSPSKRKAADEDNKRRDPPNRTQQIRLKRSKTPVFKDPLASSKLEMIKNIRAKRAAAETSITEAVEQARLLIAEAEKAAKALEVAAVRSPIARTSLLETRKLISEAIQSIESIRGETTSPVETGSTFSNESILLPPHHSYSASGLTGHIGEERKVDGSINQLQTPDGETNMFSFTHPLSFKKSGLEDTVQDSMEDDVDPYTGVPNGLLTYRGDLPPNGTETNTRSSSEGDLPFKSTITVMKKWVRGRPVEATD
ncbi:hypothetical protein SAY87_017274 [Trapa incisa]|uniref:Nuclease associated modular domain-containing protein n=1 Tax=Trapa incisa TaxID=236973 RepID=A0AAN7L2S0_9MYRT|nr:hypothetical protein SAY87_017274 [Trapa incisa]